MQKIRLLGLIFVILSLYYNFSYAENSKYASVILPSQDAVVFLADGWEYSVEGSKSLPNIVSWSNLAVPMTGLPGGVLPGGVYWLRCRFVIAKLPDGLSLSLNLGRIDSADEAFVNGRGIGGTGEMSASGGRQPANDFDTERIYTIPADCLSPDGTNTVAIRIRDGIALPGSSGIYESVPVIGYTLKTFFLFYYRETFDLTFFGLTFLIFLYFLFFFINRPKSREYLYLTLLLGLSSLIIFLDTGWGTALGITPFAVVRLREYLLIAVCPVFLFFIEETLETKTIPRSWDNARIRTSGMFALFCGLVLIAAFIAGKDPENFSLVRRFSSVTVASGILLSGVILVRAVRGSKSSAGFLLASLFILTVVMSAGWLSAKGIIHAPDIFNYGVIVFFIAISEIISSGFVRLRRTLIGVNAKLNHLDDMKNRFISNVSKELAEPLKSIRERAAALMETKEPTPEARTEEYLKMQSEIRRAMSLFERVFLTSKIDMGELVVRLETVSLAPVIRDAVSALNELASRRNIALDISRLDHVKLTADAKNLRTALFEILENAVYYSRPGGRVSVYVRAVGNAVEISVSDEGAGILPNETDLIFQKFYRSKAAEIAHPNGKGIGLYLAYQLIREMRGNIRVIRRERETGSIFIVTLKRTMRASEGDRDE